MLIAKNPDYKQTVQAIFRQAPFIQHLGIELTDIGPGWCETTLVVRTEHLQQDGFIHAGVQATLADHTAGAAAGSLIAPGEIVLTAEFKINLLRPAIGEHLRGRADVLRAGKTLTVVESSVYAKTQEGEKLVSKATVTLAVVEGKSY
ncbi:MAG: PaaI family thioesterase [Chloroflexi bacterium]|nr:PaaI family thioesterase [Chloroflexota bacterium]MBP8059254.1 PaaI family thioesterase [Chloroflexota bacterium]